MTWAKLDDQLHGDPRAVEAGLEAMGLYALALSCMGAYLTDGEITAAQVKRIAGRKGPALARRLVTVGLWAELEAGAKWVLISWENSLLSRRQVEDNRARKSDFGRRGGEAKAAKLHESSLAPCHVADSAPVPSRPVPSQEREEPPVGPPEGPSDSAFKLEPPPPPKAKRSGRAKVERMATTLPNGWQPASAAFSFGTARGLDEQRVRLEGEKFAAHHTAKGSTYIDWDAAFRTWLLKAPEFARPQTRLRAEVDDFARPQDSDNWPEAALVPDPPPRPRPVRDDPPDPRLEADLAELRKLTPAQLDKRLNDARGFAGYG